VDFWCRNKRPERLLIVQTDGDIAWDHDKNDFDWAKTTALPRRLSTVFTDEPRWIDARWARTGAHATLRDPRFRDLTAELAAPLRGIAKDELIGEDIRQHRRLNRWRNAALGVVTMLLIGAVAAAAIAIAQRDQAQLNQSRALTALAKMEAETGSPATALRVALAVLPRGLTGSEPPHLLEAQGALHRSLASLHEIRRIAHDDSVTSVHFSPDGRTVLTGSNDKTARLWEVETGRELRVLRGHEDGVTSVAFSPDGRTVLTGSKDKTARLWDVATGKEVGVLGGHDTWVRSVAFSPDGHTLVIALWDETARLWDVSTRREIATLQSQQQGVWSVAFSPDGRTVLTGGTDDRTARLWDVASGKERGVLRGHQHFVESVAFSPDGRTILTSSADRTARLWDGATGAEIRVLRGHENSVNSAAFSPDGRTVVTGSTDKTARLWDVATGTEVGVLRGHENSIESVALSSDGHTVVTGSMDKTARLWDVATGKQIGVLHSHGNVVKSVAFSADSRTVAAALHWTVRLWEVASGREIARIRGDNESIDSVALSPDGHTLAIGSSNMVRFWDLAIDQEIRSLRHSSYRSDSVSSIAFSPDGRTLFTGSVGKVQLWEVKTGKNIATLADNNSPVAVSPDGRMLASQGTAFRGQTVRLSAVSTGKEIDVLHGHTDDVWSIAFSPDGHTLATSSSDKTARVWEVATTRKEICVLRGHDSWVTSVAFSPDGRTLATGSEDRTVRLWAVATCQEIAVLRRHENRVTSVSFSPDGRTLATGSWDEHVRLWPVGQRLIDLACAHVHELPLSERDKQRFGIADEWCTPEMSAKLRAELGLDEPDKNAAALSFLDQGHALFSQAYTKAEEEADSLYTQAGEKYAAALGIKPDMHEALNEWGMMFLDWSSRKQGREAERMLKEAEDKLLRAEKLKMGSASYNLACVAARRGDEESSKKFLTQAKEHGDLPPPWHLRDDPDLVSIRDKPWFQEFLAGNP
jgi:WD40 repeat protein